MGKMVNIEFIHFKIFFVEKVAYDRDPGWPSTGCSM
jgi:hypothetical protein